MRPLRICFVAYRGNMQCGGQGIYLWHLARELSRRGHAVDVVVGPPHPDPMPFARSVSELPNEQYWAKWFLRERAGFVPREEPLRALRPLPFFELAASRLGFLPEPFAFSLRALRRLSAGLREGRRWDVVHDVQCLGWGLLGIRALGLPVVTTVHHPLTVDRRASFVRDRGLRDAIGTMTFYPVGMQSFVARRAAPGRASSAASAAEIGRDFRVPAERIRMVANGVDTDFWRPDPAEPRAEDEVLCVGRASDPNKGVATLVRALARLPREARVTLVDHAASSAPKWARALGCGDRLRVTGRVSAEELRRLYRRASVVAVPSRYEGFGLPAVEALACGTPVVASAAGALPEVLGAVGGGILVPPGSPRALADALAALLADPERRAGAAARARERVEALYAWPRVAASTEAVYAEVVAERRGLPARSTTSAHAGARRATPPSAASAARAGGAGHLASERVQGGKPHRSESPSTTSSSRLRDACSRMTPSS